jgi:hypothetical protein
VAKAFYRLRTFRSPLCNSICPYFKEQARKRHTVSFYHPLMGMQVQLLQPDWRVRISDFEFFADLGGIRTSCGSTR